jgi:hypothetical protein
VTAKFVVSHGNPVRQKVGRLDPEPCVVRWRVTYCTPSIIVPVHHCRCRHFQAECFAPHNDGPTLLVESLDSLGIYDLFPCRCCRKRSHQTFTVFTMRGLSTARRPKATGVRASGLTMCTAGSARCPGGWFLISTDPASNHLVASMRDTTQRLSIECFPIMPVSTGDSVAYLIQYITLRLKPGIDREQGDAGDR